MNKDEVLIYILKFVVLSFIVWFYFFGPERLFSYLNKKEPKDISLRVKCLVLNEVAKCPYPEEEK